MSPQNDDALPQHDVAVTQQVIKLPSIVPGHWGRGMEASGPLVPAGGGYRERDARFSTLNPDAVAAHVAETQIRSKMLMLEREAQIDAGLEHQPAAYYIGRGENPPVRDDA